MIFRPWCWRRVQMFPRTRCRDRYFRVRRQKRTGLLTTLVIIRSQQKPSNSKSINGHKNMKKLITIAILTLGAALNFAARASTISGPVEDLTGSTNTVNVVLMLKQPVTNGGVFIYTSQKQFTATNGYLGPITNVQPGNYNVQIGPRNDLLQMTVPADTNTYTLQALINGGITWPYSTSPSFLLLSGGTMTGNLTAPAFIGDGSGITNLNPLNLSSAVT